MIGPQALPGEHEHSVTLDLGVAISDTIITEKNAGTVLSCPTLARLGRTVEEQEGNEPLQALTLALTSAPAGRAGRQILFLLDRVNLDPLANTRANRVCVSDTDLRVKCTASHTVIWWPVCCTGHGSTEPFSQSKCPDSVTQAYANRFTKWTAQCVAIRWANVLDKVLLLYVWCCHVTMYLNKVQHLKKVAATNLRNAGDEFI